MSSDAPKNPKFREMLQCALRASRLGREVLAHYFGRLEQVSEKFQAGLVSEADRESERVIKEYLKRSYPEFDFLGEESTLDLSQVRPKVQSGRWILDPLDGTTNYIHRFPIYAVSLGLEYEGQLTVGVVDVPQMGEVYTAVRGEGAYLNGRILAASRTSKLSEAFVATGFVPDIEENLDEQLRVFTHLVRKVRAVRRAGAAAYDLALVAKGVFDGYWEKGLKPWDSAAGTLLVREAGGLVETYRGKSYDPFCRTIVAGSPQVVKSLQHEMAQFISKDSD